MSWLNGLSTEERHEMEVDACTAYNAGTISQVELIFQLAKLGWNATDINDAVNMHRPTPPEDEGE